MKKYKPEYYCKRESIIDAVPHSASIERGYWDTDRNEIALKDSSSQKFKSG